MDGVPKNATPTQSPTEYVAHLEKRLQTRYVIRNGVEGYLVDDIIIPRQDFYNIYPISERVMTDKTKREAINAR